MDPIDTLAAGIKHVDALLDEGALEPDLERNDWDRMKVRIGMVRDGIDDVLGALDEALEAAEQEEVRSLIKRRVAALLGHAGAMFFASGDERAASTVRGRAIELSPDEQQRAELTAGDAEPRAWTRLAHARWLLFHGKRDDADRLANAVLRESKADPIRRGAREILRAPRPITSAPPLFRINGCGVGLYGERDRGEDGWYVATYFICVLFIPIFPLTAYRVRRTGDSSYQFIARESLGPIARAWQILGLAAAVLGVGGAALSSYLDSPARKARVAIEEAQVVEKRGDREAALERYSDATRRYGDTQDVSVAAEAVIRLTAASVPEPCTAEAVDKVGRVVDAFHALPPRAQAAAAGALLKRLDGWAAQIGDGSVPQIDAGLTVLDMAAKIAANGLGHADIDARRAKLRRALAGRVVAVRPLRALALYVRPPVDAEGITAARTIVDSFGTAPSLWIEAERDVGAWADAAEKRAGQEEAAKRAREQVRAAHDAHDADEKLIAAGDEKQIAAALARAPQDQELAVAVAQVQRRKGDSKAALATLGALGAPGRLTTSAQMVLAASYAEAGDMAKADAVLTDLVAERLPAFQEAQRALEGAAVRAEKAYIDRARAGDIEPTLKSRLESAAEADRPTVFRTWVSEKLSADPELKSLRAEYVRHDAVVPASLSLGTVKLRRASAAAGDARRALLAEAEKVYLSIHNEGEGNPGYHLGLGQVYHRLGRTEDGNRELTRVLAQKDPGLTLEAARIYRDLGLSVRARQIVEDLWKSASEDRWKHAAAALMSHLVRETNGDETDEETWLKRSDTNEPDVKLLLLQLEARRLRRQGKFAEADTAFGRIAEGYERSAAHDATSANNAAVSYHDRYSVTGDPAHLRSAVKQLENAHRLVPQNAIVTGNLAGSCAHFATITVLDRWIKTRSLALDDSEARAVLDAILSGPLREEALAALRKDPSFHRALELTQEEQALAPQRQGGYLRQLAWLDLIADDKAIVELGKRVTSLPPFDGSGLDEARKAGKEKGRLEQDKTAIAQAVKHAEETVARVEHARHAPTLAAARMVLALHRSALVRLDPTPSHVEAAIDAHRKAAEAWPEGGLDEGLPSALARTSLLRAAPEVPSIATHLAKDDQEQPTWQLLARVVTDADGAAATAALRRRPEIQEAARLAKARMGKRPDITAALLARIAGDTEMEQAASAVYQRADVGAALQMRATLAPGQALEKSQFDFWKSGGKSL
ncbi:Hypothetical protein A7982_03544 [Minicystis rosea]|nr:Hypothetical protein A7982_03544 [Minicystis rosea]